MLKRSWICFSNLYGFSENHTQLKYLNYVIFTTDFIKEEMNFIS